jgi:hypothetical protein
MYREASLAFAEFERGGPAANAEIQRKLDHTDRTRRPTYEAPTAATRTIAGAWFTGELGNQTRVIEGA